ncbi:MAG: LPS export ABC transporter ATP-binding protein [Armatimonadetes bacterium]|nr:LPS export ABC transporter ATP-binding protein [Armatimonadota bacterium]
MSLACQELVKVYRGRRVVDNLSFTAARGETVGILGPNGAGKTTTFYMVLGLARPDSGVILFEDHDITHLSVARRSKMGIGYLAQEASIFRKLTVLQNVMLYLEAAEYPAAGRYKRAMQLLGEFGVDARAQEQSISLSGGERRRVEIARALAADPAFILLDEPFTGIDPIAINDIKSIIRSLAERNIGIIITDHNVRDTLSICDRAYIVAQGRIVTSGTSQTIPDDPLARQFYLGEDYEA